MCDMSLRIMINDKMFHRKVRLWRKSGRMCLSAGRMLNRRKLVKAVNGLIYQIGRFINSRCERRQSKINGCDERIAYSIPIRMKNWFSNTAQANAMSNIEQETMRIDNNNRKPLVSYYRDAKARSGESDS